MRINRFWQMLAEMLLCEHAIERKFVIPSFLTNVSAVPREHEIGSLQLYCILKTTLLWLALSSTLIDRF